MKIIDLLNMISNGEAPTIIKFQNYIWTLNKQFKDYSDDDRYLFCDYMPDVVSIEEFLNDEVEIIEDKKIEKIDQNNHQWKYGYKRKVDDDIQNNIEILRQKVNEIIEELNRRE